MRKLSYQDIQAMKGNGSSVRMVLKYFIDKGATIELLHEDLGTITDRFFLVHYQGLTIPLRAYKLNIYTIYNSTIAQGITSDKLKSQAALQAWDIQAPATLLHADQASAQAFVQQHSKYVVKPRKGAHGEGITIAADESMLDKAVEQARTIHPDVLIQQFVDGGDYRLLFIDYKFVAAVKRVPASVVGDGQHTVEQLVADANAQKSTLWAQIRSGDTDAEEVNGSISKTPIDEIVAARGQEFLQKVPGKDEKLALLDKANVSLGGQTMDVTDKVSQELCGKITKLLKAIELPLCGVDVLSGDIGSEKESFVIELNAAPGLRLHEHPAEGQPHHVCAQLAESLVKHYQGFA